MEGPAGAELSSEAVLSFLAARGGRVRHAELVQHFQGALGGEAEQRARARAHFKELVNAVAKVRTDPADGAKYVHLKKRFCEGAPPSESESESGAGVPPSSSSNSNSSISAADNAQKATRDESAESTERIVSPATPPSQDCDGPGPAVMPGPPSPSQAGDPPSDGAQTEEDSKRLQQQPSDLGSSVAPEHPQIPSLQDSDAGSAPPGGGPAPRSARQNLRDLLAMGAGGAGASSPQLKRSPGNSSGGGGGGRGKSGGDSDTASVASSSAEEESTGGGSVTLDPLEHAWMLSASDGKWDSLEELLACEPGLLTKRDFITGFTCLHWAAKHGRQELLALLVNFAGKHQLPVNINARTSGGYTALHLAAMHGHVEVVKLLVGAYDADVDIRDYSGKKAYQYLSQSSEEIKNLAGALEEEEEEESASSSGSGRWRLSKVLPSHLIAHRLSHVPEDGGDHHCHHHPHHHIAEGWAAGKVKDPARKIAGSSSGRMRPRLNKIRFRTQIVHTTPPFKDLEQQPLEEGDEEDLDRSLKGHSSAFKFRPKSNVFG